MARTPFYNKTSFHLLQYDDEFLSRLVTLCKHIKEWDAILETIFEIPFTTSIYDGERFMRCPNCNHADAITLSLNKPRFPRWKCNSLCHSSLQDNIISLLTLFTDKSPLQILETLESRFIPDVVAVRKCAPVKPKKTKSVPAKKSTGKVLSKKKTPPVSSRKYSDVANAIFSTKK